MKKSILYVLAIAIFIAAAPAFAGHDHGGSQDSMEQGTSQRQAAEQSAKTAELLLKSCIQQVDSIQRYIDKLQTNLNGKRAASSITDQLEELEQKLKEAKAIVRAIQLF